MLILTRRVNEAIMIGKDVKLTVLRILGGQVRIGIDAPHDMKIFREELLHRLQQQDQAAAKPPDQPPNR